MHTKDEYLDATREQLDLWGRQLATLERQLLRSASEHRATVRDEVRDLCEKRDALADRLRETAAAEHASSVWSAVQEPLEQAVDEFRRRAAKVYDKAKAVG